MKFRKTKKNKRKKSKRRNKSRRRNKKGGVKVVKPWPSEWNDYQTLVEGGEITPDDECILCLGKFSSTQEQAIYRLSCCNVLVHNDCLLWLCNMKDMTRPADMREVRRLHEERQVIIDDQRLSGEQRKEYLRINEDSIHAMEQRIMDSCPNCRFNEKTTDAQGKILDEMGFHDCMNVYAFRNKVLHTANIDTQPRVRAIYDANPPIGDKEAETEYLKRNISGEK